MLEPKNPNENIALYEFGRFRVFPREHRLLSEEVVVPLTAKTFGLLLALVERAGRLVTREELIGLLWPKTVVEEHNLTWNVSILRKALGDEGDTPRFIETVRGQGYRFIAPVAVVQAAETQVAAETKESQASPRRVWLAIAAAGAIALAMAVGSVVWLRHGTATLPNVAGGHSIAVLPFENLSSDPANIYFANGIQDTILTKLASISSLRVISRTSTERYPSHPSNLKTIAAELGVGAILEGSVQRSGNQVLINAQLIDAQTDDHLWAQAYTRTLDNVFDVESDVASQVANALKTRLLPSEAANVARAPTESSRAYDLFLRAEYMAMQIEEGMSKTPVATINQGAELYRAAIAEDAAFALAYARLSYLESYAYWFDFDHTPERIADADRAAQRALELAPDLWHSHLAMGYVHYWGYRNYDAALREFEIARSGMPNNADVTAAIAYIERRRGKWDSALDGLERATQLDPRNPRWLLSLGDTLTDLRRYDAAVAAFDRELSIEPNDYNATGRKIWVLTVAGRLDDASRALASIPVSVDPEDVISTLRFEVARLNRRPDAALAALQDAPKLVQTPLWVGEIPTDLMRGQAWQLKGESTRAGEAYNAAKAVVVESLRTQPEDADLLSQLSVIEANLGHKEEAVRIGRQAAQLLPMTKDSLYGLVYQTTLARVYAQCGQTSEALDILSSLLKQPAGVFLSPWLLKNDPVWDPLRSDPRFLKLLSIAD
jgi:TolB-like protein/DNA-binding winged helix-turn-helix (wHTH) protein/Flp pilus assembly protein TadD